MSTPLVTRHIVVLTLLALIATALAACGGAVGAQQAAPTSAPTNPPAAQKPAGLPPAPTPAPKTSSPTTAPAKAAATAPAKTAPTTAPSTSSAAAPTLAMSGDAKDALMKVFAAQQAAKAWRATQTVDSSGKTSHRTIEYVAPDRYHMKTDTAEVIIIGGKAYQNANGKWMESPAMAGVFQPMLEEFKKLPVEMTDVKIVGTEDVNGVKATVFQFNSSAKVGDQTVNSAVKVWARPSDNLPIKQEVTGEFAGRKSTTTQTFDYAPNLKVDPPM